MNRLARAAAWFLLPGTLVRQALTLGLCRWLGVRVVDAAWFCGERPVPPVRYDTGARFVPGVCLTAMPFLVQSLLAILFCLPGVIALLAFGVFDPIACLCLWPGLALALCAVPPLGAIESVWLAVRRHARRRAALALLAWPVVGLLWLVHRARGLRADLWSAAVPAVVVPLLLLHLGAR